MIGFDTNVVVRHLVQDDPAQARAATIAFERLSPSNPGFLTTTVLVETYWVLTRAYRIAPGTVLGTLRDLADCAEIVIQDEPEVRAAWRLADDGADFADALISAACSSRGCAAVLSFDRAAQERLRFQQPESA